MTVCSLIIAHQHHTSRYSLCFGFRNIWPAPSTSTHYCRSVVYRAFVMLSMDSIRHESHPASPDVFQPVPTQKYVQLICIECYDFDCIADLCGLKIVFSVLKAYIAITFLRLYVLFPCVANSTVTYISSLTISLSCLIIAYYSVLFSLNITLRRAFCEGWRCCLFDIVDPVFGCDGAHLMSSDISDLFRNLVLFQCFCSSHDLCVIQVWHFTVFYRGIVMF